MTLASVCESKKMMTSALAILAPANLAPIRPVLFSRWITCVSSVGKVLAKYLSTASLQCAAFTKTGKIRNENEKNSY